MQLATSPDSKSELSPMPCPSRGPDRASHRARRRPGFTRLPRPGCRLAATDPASLASVSHRRLSHPRQRSDQASVMIVLARIRTYLFFRSERRPKAGISRKNGVLSGGRNRPPTGDRPPSLTPRPRLRAGPGQGTHCTLSCTIVFCLEI